MVSSETLDTVVAGGNRVLVQQRRRRGMVAGLDALAWVVATFLAVTLRLDFTLTFSGWVATFLLGMAAAALQVGIGYYIALYRGRYAFGSFEVVRMLATVVLGIAIALSFFVIPFGIAIGVPRATMLLAGPFALLLMFGIRYVSRLAFEHSRKPGDAAERALIVGAGYLGDRLLHTIITDPGSPIRPVGLIDDDPLKKNLNLRGVPVLGRTGELAEIAQRTRATRVVIALGNADSVLLRKLNDAAGATGMSVSVTPTITDFVLNERATVDVRDIEIEDLIGRHPVDTNVELIAGVHHGQARARHRRRRIHRIRAVSPAREVRTQRADHARPGRDRFADGAARYGRQRTARLQGGRARRHPRRVSAECDLR